MTPDRSNPPVTPSEADAILDSLPLYVYRVDCDGRIIYANQTLLNQLQLQLHELIGKTAYDFYPASLAAKYRRDDARVLESGESLQLVEENIHPVSGRCQFVEVHKSPTFNHQGEVTGVQGVFWDISERFTSDLQTQRSEALLKTIAEHSPNMVLLLNDQLQVLYANRAPGGRDARTIIGQSFARLASSAHKLAEDRLQTTLATGKPTRFELEVQLPEDGTSHLEVRAVRLDRVPEDAQLLLSISDISDRVAGDQQLRQAAAVFTYAREAILIADAVGKIIDVNQAFIDITGYAASDCLQHPYLDFLNEDNNNSRMVEINSSVRNKGYWQGELRIRHQCGNTLICQVAVSAIRSQTRQLQSLVVLLSDITRQKEHQHQLEHIAHYDTLTNLPNRYLFNEKLREEMSRASNTGRRLAVVYLDLDGFKEVNDRHGHQVGDHLLINLGKRITDTLDARDTVARLGGDEFVIVVPETDQRPDVKLYYQSLLAAISRPIHSNVGVIELSASLGITYFPQQLEVDPDHLIRQADIAMYDAKVHGKNRFAEFDFERDEHQRGFGQLLAELGEAIPGQQLELYLQPKVDMSTGDILGAEALVRWNNPKRGFLTPENFLKATDNDPLAISLDNWVLDEALRFLGDCQPEWPLLQISINITMLSLERPGFTDTLSQLLQRYHIQRPDRIMLEVLESSAVADVDQVSQVIRDCKTLGVCFSLDDFGTGFSTLSFLKKLPVDELKIDRTFVRDMLHDPDDLAIIKGILGLAEAFQKSVVAEGVETEAHGIALLRLGCRHAQGFGIASPMPAHLLLDWCRQWMTPATWARYAEQ